MESMIWVTRTTRNVFLVVNIMWKKFFLIIVINPIAVAFNSFKFGMLMETEIWNKKLSRNILKLYFICHYINIFLSRTNFSYPVFSYKEGDSHDISGRVSSWLSMQPKSLTSLVNSWARFVWPQWHLLWNELNEYNDQNK